MSASGPLVNQWFITDNTGQYLKKMFGGATKIQQKLIFPKPYYFHSVLKVKQFRKFVACCELRYCKLGNFREGFIFAKLRRCRVSRK